MRPEIADELEFSEVVFDVAVEVRRRLTVAGERVGIPVGSQSADPTPTWSLRLSERYTRTIALSRMSCTETSLR